MYTIKEVAEQVGVSASTLRAWERRYGVVEPGRTEGGYRVYSEHDVQLLGQMARLVDQGSPPRLAARQATNRGDTAAEPITTQHTLIESFVNAAAALDGRALGVSLDAMFALGSFEAVADTHLLPALEALGNAWSVGRVSVAGEHLAAHAVMRRLSAAYEAAAVLRTGPRVLIGLAPGGRHELGLLAFAIAARRHGINTDYLGSNLPVDDWSSAVGSPDVAAAVLAIATPADVAPTRQVIRASHTRSPDLLVAVGGAEQDRAQKTTVRLGHHLGDAARLLAEELAARSGSAQRSGPKGRVS